MKPIYDVDVRGYGTGLKLSLAGALAHQAVQGGTVMESTDGGRTWHTYEPEGSQ